MSCGLLTQSPLKTIHSSASGICVYLMGGIKVGLGQFFLEKSPLAAQFNRPFLVQRVHETAFTLGLSSNFDISVLLSSLSTLVVLQSIWESSLSSHEVIEPVHSRPCNRPLILHCPWEHASHQETTEGQGKCECGEGEEAHTMGLWWWQDGGALQALGASDVKGKECKWWRGRLGEEGQGYIWWRSRSRTQLSWGREEYYRDLCFKVWSQGIDDSYVLHISLSLVTLELTAVKQTQVRT